jgi:hypothetical protein
MLFRNLRRVWIVIAAFLIFQLGALASSPVGLPRLGFIVYPPSMLRVLGLEGVAAQISNPRPMIKSVQRGSITVASASLTNTATITSVDTNNSFVQHLGSYNGGVCDDAIGFAYFTLTNATTVTATRGAQDGTNYAVPYYQVVEMWPGSFKSRQTGTGTYDTSPKNITVSAVDLNKAYISFGGFTNGSSGTTCSYMHIGLTLTSTTNLQASSGAQNNQVFSYTILESF